MDSCISSLSILLSNEDPQISEPAMKCFVGLADRFIRRGKDPAPIVENGLIEELIRRLAQVGQPASSSGGGQGGGGAAPPEKPSGHSVTTIINLLSTLCRGSPNITHVSIGSGKVEGGEGGIGWSSHWQGFSRLVILYFLIIRRMTNKILQFFSLSIMILSIPKYLFFSRHICLEGKMQMFSLISVYG